MDIIYKKWLRKLEGHFMMWNEVNDSITRQCLHFIHNVNVEHEWRFHSWLDNLVLFT